MTLLSSLETQQQVTPRSPDTMDYWSLRVLGPTFKETCLVQVEKPYLKFLEPDMIYIVNFSFDYGISDFK